jgi:uncharacterized protein YjbI with pentapeptide repeats
MANEQHIEWLKEGAEAWNARRAENDFVPDFSDMDRGTSPSFPMVLIEFNLENANFINSALNGVKFLGCDLRGVNFVQSRCLYADFTGSDLRRANFSIASLQYTRFVESNLDSAILDSARLDYADLSKSSLRWAKLVDVDFGGASLTSSNFQEADLDGAILHTGSLVGLDVRGVDLSHTKHLRKAHYRKMRGDRHTKLPSRLPFPPEWNDASLDQPLDNPVVKASPYEFEVRDGGVHASLPRSHGLDRTTMRVGSLQRAEALILNCRSIADSVSNKLGEEARRDLLSYAQHLEENDVANPHRLEFLASGLRADLTDSLISDGFSARLKTQLRGFLEQHGAFIAECAPDAAEAIEVKNTTELSRVVTKEESTAILDKLEAAITNAEAATESYIAAIQELRDHDQELNKLSIKVYSAEEKEKFDRLVARQTTEFASFGARLYFRAQEAINRVRPYAGDAAIVSSVTGTNVPEMAQKIIDGLAPVVMQLKELIPSLPPLG